MTTRRMTVSGIGQLFRTKLELARQAQDKMEKNYPEMVARGSRWNGRAGDAVGRTAQCRGELIWGWTGCCCREKYKAKRTRDDGRALAPTRALTEPQPPSIPRYPYLSRESPRYMTAQHAHSQARGSTSIAHHVPMPIRQERHHIKLLT